MILDNSKVILVLCCHSLRSYDEARPSVDCQEIIILSSSRLGSLLGPIDSTHLLSSVTILIFHESIGIPIIIDVDFIN